MMSRAEQWDKLRRAGLLDGEDVEPTPRPVWFIRALQGFAAWVASFFLIGFLVSLIGISDSSGAMLAIGIVLIAGSWTLLRLARDSDFLNQLALAASLAGQLMITIAAFDFADGNVTVVAVFILVMAIVLILAMDDFLQRFLATIAAGLAVAFLSFDNAVAGLGPPLVAAFCCALWLTEERWGAQRKLLEPVALGTGLTTLMLGLWFSGTVLSDQLGFDNNLIPYWFDLLVMLALILLTLSKILNGLEGISVARRTAWLLIAAVVGVVVVYALPGAGSAVLIVLLAIRSQRVILGALALATLLTFFARYYYALEITLLTKSMLLIGGGIIFLALYLLLRRFDGMLHNKASAWLMWPGKARWLAGGLVVMAVVFVLNDARNNEQTLDNGRVVLLELAPVDPRSLMQGDYMRLRFAVERQLLSRLGDDIPRRGEFLVRIDADGVGEFVAQDAADPVAVDVVRIPFRRGGMGVEILTNAWFFQEGDAALYENARFGEFRVGDDGRILLNAMRDERRDLLGSDRGSE